MARPDLFLHPKFRRLVHVLQEPEPHVLGYLEMMWHVGYASGNAELGDAVDVELAAKYPGTRGKLCAALLECGFLDHLEDERFAIHDLHDHAPKYVHDRARKENERRKEKKCSVCGITFHSTEAHAVYCGDACRQAAYRDRKTGVTEGDGGLRNDSVTVTQRYAPPSPSPSPSPSSNTPQPPKGGKRSRRKKTTPEMEAIARRVVEHYQATVQTDHGKEGGVNNVLALLADGHTEDRLRACADGYAAVCRTKRTESKYRLSARNFFGRTGGYKDYLDHLSTPATPAVDEIDLQAQRRRAEIARLGRLSPNGSEATHAP